jgi:hypothetical protein
MCSTKCISCIKLVSKYCYVVFKTIILEDFVSMELNILLKLVFLLEVLKIRCW